MGDPLGRTLVPTPALDPTHLVAHVGLLCAMCLHVLRESLLHGVHTATHRTGEGAQLRGLGRDRRGQVEREEGGGGQAAPAQHRGAKSRRIPGIPAAVQPNPLIFLTDVQPSGTGLEPWSLAPTSSIFSVILVHRGGGGHPGEEVSWHPHPGPSWLRISWKCIGWVPCRTDSRAVGERTRPALAV